LIRLRLLEMSIEYDLPLFLLYPSSNTVDTAFHGYTYPENAPIYLISESPEKIVLQSKIRENWYDASNDIDVIYAVEKTDEDIHYLGNGTTKWTRYVISP